MAISLLDIFVRAPVRELTRYPDPLAGADGDWLPLRLLEPQSSQCREAAKYVQICIVPQNALHMRLLIGGARAAGIRCFYSAARPEARLQGLIKGKGAA